MTQAHESVDVMEMIDTIKKLPSESEVIALTRQCVKALGAEHFVYTSFLGDHEDPMQESRRFFIGCPPAWCQIYNSRKWFETDPFVVYARSNNTAPIFGSDIVCQTQGQVEMLETAGKNGFNSCMVIPVHTGNIRHMGMLYIGSPDSPLNGEQNLKRHRGFYRLLAVEMLDWWILRIREEAIATYKLDTKEILVLKLELEGLVAKEKAVELGMPVNAIYSIYRKIKSKFSVNDIKDAARIAHTRGIVNYVGAR